MIFEAFTFWTFTQLIILGLFTFFRKIVIIGRANVPRKGPVIICSNHPNMVLDPCLVAYSCGRRDGHFWAMAPLFKGFKGKLLRSLGAIPVQRRQDNEGKPVDNDTLFDSSYEVLQAEKALYIFPEGTSEHSPHLLPIKTGTLRLVLGLLQKSKGKINVPIIPVGLNYTRKDKFRSKVMIQYGPPIELPANLVNDKGEIVGEDDEHEIVKKYTMMLEERLRALTPNAPDWETLMLLTTARRLYVNGRQLTLQQHFELSKRFATAWSKFGGSDPRFQALRKEIADYDSELERLNLRDVYFTCGLSMKQLSWLLAKRVIALLIILPLALPGAFLHAPIYLVSKLLERKAKYVQSKSMIKLSVSVFFTAPLVYTLTILLAGWFWGLKIMLITALLLPIFGLSHIKLLEEGIMISRSVLPIFRVIGLMLLGFRTVLQDLQKQREELVNKINGLVDAIYPDKRQRVLSGTEKKSALDQTEESIFV